MRIIYYLDLCYKHCRRFIKRSFLYILFIVFFVIATFAVQAVASTATEKPPERVIASTTTKPATTTTSTTTTTTSTTTTTIPPTTTTPPTTQPAVVSYGEGEIQNYISQKAIEYGLDPQRMLRIAKCESGFNPGAINKNYYAGGGNPSGLYQYLPETWSRIGGRSGLQADNVFDWQQNVNVTMWAFANGYAGEWACK